MKGLVEIGFEAMDISTSKGFLEVDYLDWEKNPEKVASRIALIHSELSEALEEIRDPAASLHHFAEELADVIIRTCSLARGLGLDLDQNVEEKLFRNRSRPILHGGKRL